MEIQQSNNSNQWIIRPKGCPFQVSELCFEPDHLERNGLIDGYSHGRNTTYFFHQNENHFVLRHYYRGGLVGRFIHDSYWFTSIESTRAYRELQLLIQLKSKGLPVPTPVAGRITRQGLYYQADLILEKIPSAMDLFHWLKKQPLSHHQWALIGQLIAKFHHEHLFHADLNIHNIMLDENDLFWLIDFDKSCFKPNQNSWTSDNLNRLLRSLRKEKKKFADFHWQEQDWSKLIKGYQNQH